MTPRTTASRTPAPREIFAVAVSVVVLGSLMAVLGKSGASADLSLLDKALNFISARDYHAAGMLTERYLGRVDASCDDVELLFQMGRQFLVGGRLVAAEACLRRVLQHDAEHVLANDHLAFLLRIEGRLWESRQPLLALFRGEHFMPMEDGRLMATSSADYLVAASTTESLVLDDGDVRFAEMCHNGIPDDFLPYLGQARRDLWTDDVETANSIFQKVAAKHTELIEAHVGIGTVLLRQRDAEGFLKWKDRLPETAGEHPDVWVLLGIFADDVDNNPQTAARCYHEAVHRHPGHRTATYRLARSLSAIGRTHEAANWSEHAARLAQLEYAVREVTTDSRRIREVVELLESLGRYHEAIGWCHFAIEVNVDAEWANERIRDLRPITRTFASLVAAEYHRPLDVSWPELTIAEVRLSVDHDDRSARPTESSIRFTDDAARLGLNFTYFNGAEANDDRAWMFEFSGGGVAAPDMDADGWPDAYLTQGCRWPSVPETASFTDQAFRNLSGQRFEDITEVAGLGDLHFTSGATHGDFDGDGFDDLYLSNIGPNGLYRNNGDGTYTRLSKECGAAGNDWTLSSAMADLNGDGLADIYAVNYLAGDVIERSCSHRGRPVQCYPTSFPAAQDRLYLNVGDGKFADVTDSAGVCQPGGKGMGVVAADLDGSGRLSLFVANDTTANFLFKNMTPHIGASPVFVEIGLPAGVALGSDGQAQSGMGIACGDVDNDARIDFFVTNYYLEANNLFVQFLDGLFQDQARRFRAGDSGYTRMGWGTQFLDADLDGDDDLIVANGHLDDYSNEGVPFRMPPACYRNLNGSELEDVAGTAGDFFEQPRLGRAVARIDWNRDGLPDFVMTHVDSPAALLTNETANKGNFITVRLVGTESERRAVGTRVTVDCAGQSWTRQLTAGDGFAASNERCLLFGTGDSRIVDRATIHWPSGRVQAFHHLDTRFEYTLVEGSTHIRTLPK